MPHKRKLTRRKFLIDSASAATVTVVAAELAPRLVTSASAASDAEFKSQWQSDNDRVWIGPECWANPMQDWRLAAGRLECANAAFDRNVQLLTRQTGETGGLRMSVRIGRLEGGPLGKGAGSAGFRIGIMGPLREYRNSLIYGKGLDAGFTAGGGLFIGDVQAAKAGEIPLAVSEMELRLSIETSGDAARLTLAVHEIATGKLLGEVSRPNIPSAQLAGNIALVANFGQPPAAGAQQPAAKGKAKGAAAGPGTGRFWFSDWRIAGNRLQSNPDRAFGPILFNQYTLSGSVLKMTAQMPPVGAKDSQTVRLQLARGPSLWETVAEETIHPEARTATFRVANWNAAQDVPYRLAYTMLQTDGRKQEHYWSGTIRRDPADQPVVTVADVSCNIHAAFPNAPYARNMARLNPDLMAFVGDQFYESTGGYGVVRNPVDTAILDYLRKWYIHGWTWRELTRDRPSVSLPDDHDVYQGNIWGEGGAAQKGKQEEGGYNMHPTWVNVVHRTQTSHHPDPYELTPAKQGISNYYGPMTYGRISFAVLADRMFKTAPEGNVPPTGGRGDHVRDPNYDPKTADLPGLKLLGDQQLKFLREWALDWRGADMKAVISQTIFTAMATHHGGAHERLIADYDANGWPQTPRNEALRVIRKAFAAHLAGDQHLPAVVHYGIDAHRDGPVAFAGPAVNVGYPRWWEPETPGENRAPGAPENTGDFKDSFGNPLTVLAVANGALEPRKTVMEAMHDKASGIGLARFDKAARKITFECWPFLADPASPDSSQFPGWPVMVDMMANYGRKAVAHLPTLLISGVKNPVVQVIREADGETEYSLRLPAQFFHPFVFAKGKYTVKIGEPETGRMKELKGIEAVPGNKDSLEVQL